MNGVIELKINKEKVVLVANCSTESFEAIANFLMMQVPLSYRFYRAIQFDKDLTDKELKKLTE